MIRNMFVCLFLLWIVTDAARAQSNLNIQFRSQLGYGSTVDLSNIWGYVDSLGNEYALVGTQTGLSIVDVTNPNVPVQKYFVPGTNSFWREVQTWGKYAYVTTEGCCNGLQIVNLSNLPGPVTSKYWTGSGPVAGQVTRIHTVHIRNGYAYLNGTQIFGGASLIVSLADPWNPLYIANTAMSLSGTSRYVHDCFVLNDTLYAAHIYGGFFSVINITNKTNPVLIATQNTPSNFTHNTWMSDNGTRVLFTTDEVSNSFLASYNVANPSNIVALDKLQGIPGSGSIVHNTYIRNSYAINSYYKDGITIVDVSRPDNMITVGRYDTYTQGSGNGFNGAWGVYPYLPSGNILVSDIDNGLFVLTPTYVRACYLEGVLTDACSNLPLNNVSVVITGGTHHTELSNIAGAYKTGTAVSGIYTVTFSKTGYSTKVLQNVSLQNGVLTSLNVQLSPVNAVAVAGAVVTNANCFGGASGTINLSVTGGAAPVSYQWSNGATVQDPAGLSAGLYTVTVTDAAGCTSGASYQVSSPPGISVSGAFVGPSCYGADDAVAYALVSGGVGPYSFNWSTNLSQGAGSSSTLRQYNNVQQIQNGLQAASFISGDSTGLDSIGAGFYILNVTDANGCTASGSIVVTDPQNPCLVTLNLRLFIEGFYQGNESMAGILNSTSTDSVMIHLADTAAPYTIQYTATGIVDVNGYVSLVYPAPVWNKSWYVVINHRNSIETWSKVPLWIGGGVVQQDFTDNSSSFAPSPATSVSPRRDYSIQE